MTPARALWLTVGFLALALAALGVALPLLPTTPFLLVAAFAFARSSDRLHTWLLTHQTFGPIIDDWRKHGAISERVKIVSALSMVAVFALSVALEVGTTVLIVQAIALIGAGTFVLSRPSPPQ
ncbi:MAG: hypothetical protein CMM46_14065 [Rhodospirillaceae bacterium]|nr:hypothetical protein [Rhodospirillaceae bacterium]|tara:strand:- start:651 stop:1019 length:369 start_codon:yes stop_codon:yes gene_type:complete